MKTTHFLALLSATLLALAAHLQSQAPVPKPPLEGLKELKARNAELLEKQKATLLKLDELEKKAEQLRFLSKRA